MIFEWDENKNRINKAKHGVDFESAATVFNDPLLVGRVERFVDGQERWQTIGMAEGLMLLLVAHLDTCDNGTIIRILSARKANNHERKRYENGTF
jgi:uncharacterized DUF497 family protein